jgi:hypothetical protein
LQVTQAVKLQRNATLRAMLEKLPESLLPKSAIPRVASIVIDGRQCALLCLTDQARDDINALPLHL